MNRASMLAGLAVLGLSAALVILPATVASAHVEKEVGPYTVAIGLGTEPAYVGYPNSVEVIIHRTKSGAGVNDAADTLKAQVRFGPASMDVALEGNFDQDSGGSPGDYRGAFIPTQPGDYTIHVSGTIDGTRIDETFTASPTTFSAVVDPQTIQFPTKVPSAAELSTKLDRQTARVQAQAVAASASAKGAADSARTLGTIGIVVGGAGLIVGIVALTRRRA